MKNEVYDRVIVGAGTAACVLAARLAADRGERVLLVEAGMDPGAGAAVLPILDEGAPIPVGGQWDWGLEARIVGERRGPLSRGRVVGGSAQINDRGAWRPPAADFVAWGQKGAPSWSWDAVRRSFISLEHDMQFGHRPDHGATGPLPITRWADEDLLPAMQAFAKAAVAVGYPLCEDLNDPAAHGVGKYPQNRMGQRRMSTARTHLDPARATGLVTVKPDTTVARILFEADHVVGFETNGEAFPASRITLSCGAPLTSALLLRSGIGPADDLARLGIPLQSDRPGVGRNLRDQPGAAIPIVPTRATGSPTWPRTQIAGRFRGLHDDPTDAASLYLCLFSGMSIPDIDAIAGTHVPTLFMLGDLAPESVGTVRLRSSNPADLPDVDLGLLSTPRDVQRMLEAFRRAWNLVNQESFLATVDSFPLITDALVSSDDALTGLLRQTVTSRWNLLGGACMGPSDDAETVVDEHCNVIGVEGLSVVDLSIVPVPLHAPAALTAMMIGEHAAPLLA